MTGHHRFQRLLPVLVCLGSGLLPLARIDAQMVERRGGIEPIEAANIGFLPHGLRVIQENGASQLIVWDLVRSIEGLTDPSELEAWENYRQLADDLWRARARVQRGDARLAEPLLEPYFDQAIELEKDAELRLIIAEALLRVRLARGAVEEAVPMALETIRLRRAGVVTDRFEGLDPVVDESLWLVPALPPLSTDANRVRALSRILEPWLDPERLGDDPHVRGLAAAHLSLAGEATDPLGEDSTPGLEFIRAALEASSSDPAVRDAARVRLAAAADAENAPAWLGAWRRWFTACSLLREQDVELDVALIELLHVPALHVARNPALAARAVALAADVLERAGRSTEADSLRRELLISQVAVRPALGPDTIPSDVPDESETP